MWTLLNLILLLYLNCEKCQGVFRLKDLRESYSEAYPKRQYISPNFTKGAPNLNVRQFDSIWRRCQEPSKFSSEQFEQLKNYYGEDFTLKETIQSMLFQPRGRIYSGDNYDTKSEDYHIALARPGGCLNLKESKPLRLVKTWGKCIRAFQYTDCFGWTLSIYPGSRVPPKTLKVAKFTEIKSIGPCLLDEFLSSSLKPDKRGEVVKNPQFKDHNPDLIEMPQNSAQLRSDRLLNDDNSTLSFAFYKLGPQNQILDILVTIGKKSMRQDNSTWRSNEIFRGNETEEGDVLCYVIPPKFGGPTNQSWNTFLGTKSAAESWANVTSNFPSPSADFETLDLALDFIYEDENRIRPLFFYYSAWIKTRFISYGRVLNGHQDNLRTSQSNNYSMRINSQTVLEEEEEVGISLTQSVKRFEKLLGFDKLSREGDSTFPNVNHEENQVWKCSVESRKFLSHFQESYLKNDAERLKSQSLALDSMVKNPVARFYSGVVYTGNHEDFTFNFHNRNGVCYDLVTLQNRVASIATFGTCVRIFAAPLCSGESLVIYPHSSKNNSLSQFLRRVDLTHTFSVGPCLLGEMDTSIQQFAPKSIFPFIINFSPEIKPGELRAEPQGSIVLYKLGLQNRTEYIHAVIEPDKYLDFANFQRDQFPVCFKNEEEKFFCYAVPPILNGPTNQSYNIFEASEDTMEDWVNLISDIHVEKSVVKVFSVTFRYDTDKSTRPTWIFYYILDLRRGTLYGQVYNGFRDNFSNYPRRNWDLPNYLDDHGFVYLSGGDLDLDFTRGFNHG